jgi:ATP/maltotriose-dependent transcriptional regulator MalT
MKNLTTEEKNYILKNYQKKSAWEMCKILNRQHKTILRFCKKQNLETYSKFKKYTKYQLCNKELEILDLMAKGFSFAEIKNELGVELTTIKTHVSHIYEKLGLSYAEKTKGQSCHSTRAVLLYLKEIGELNKEWYIEI